MDVLAIVESVGAKVGTVFFFSSLVYIFNLV